MVHARMQLNEYTNKVLGMVKAKFGLKDKSEALNKFIEEYGDEILEKQANNQYIKKIINIDKDYFKKQNKKKMSLKELDEICGVD
ncbi:MAG: DUF2683 family protein [Nanobdellota archaeon]